MYKIGPVLSVSHGIGAPSISVVLHEVTKLLRYAGVSNENMRFVRIGTSGGLGVPGGTVIVSDKVGRRAAGSDSENSQGNELTNVDNLNCARQVYNAALEPWYNAVVLGKYVVRVCVCMGGSKKVPAPREAPSHCTFFSFSFAFSPQQWPTELNKTLSEQLIACAPPGIQVWTKSTLGNWMCHPDMILAASRFSHLFSKVVSGSTMACDDFYEAQGRLDGAFCEYTVEVGWWPVPSLFGTVHGY